MAPLVASPFLERIAKGFRLPASQSTQMKTAFLTDSVEPHTGPAISIQAAFLISVGFHVLYILPFYLSSTTRPSPTLSRNAPAVIRARIRAVTVGSAIAALVTAYIVSVYGQNDWRSTVQLLGWYPFSPYDIARVLLLVAVLFAGPLFEAGVVESGWRNWIRLDYARETLNSWEGWRNLVTGPFTEELVWRSLIIPLHLITCPLYPTNLYASTLTQSQLYARSATVPTVTSTPAVKYTRSVILATPLYFGIAHIHHFFESRLTHPHRPMLASVIQTLFQFTYTTAFGWFAAYVFVRTGSLPAVVLAHSLCNWLGLPRFWGRVGQNVFVHQGRPAVANGRNVTDPKGLRSTARPRTRPSYRSEKEDEADTLAGAEDPLLGGAHGGDDAPMMHTPHLLGQQQDLGLAWTGAYYLLLIAGVVGFYNLLGPLTASKNKLAEIH